MMLNPLTFLKESKLELSRVIWPTRATTFRLTLIVIIGSVIVGLFIAGLDATITKITEKFIK